jgi:hypothetical protein
MQFITCVQSSTVLIIIIIIISHRYLLIIEEVQKNPSEKWTDIAKQLGLPQTTLNTIIAKKNKIREHTYVSEDQELATCGVVWKKCVVHWEVEVAWW